MGLRCIIPPRHLGQLKTGTIPLNQLKVVKNFAVLDIFIIRYLQGPPLHNLFSNIKVEVHYPTQALKSVKGPSNTFDLNRKWQRTLPSFGNFSWDMHRVPPPKSKYQGCNLTPCCGLEVHYPTQAFKSVKDPGNTFKISPKMGKNFAVLDIFFMGYLQRPLPLTIFFQISKLIFDTLLWA